MAFDIHRLDESDDPVEEIDEYRDELMELFAASPEGQAYLSILPGMGFWASSFIYYGMIHVGPTLPNMEEHDLEELLTEVFPRKISLQEPEQADEAIPELVAFWDFLKREFKLANADKILNYLLAVKPGEFRGWMNDSSRFGMAKSLFSMGQSAGFGMSDKTGIDDFMNAYNQSLSLSRGIDLLPGVASSGGGRIKKDPDKARRLRKIAKDSRKKNRKRK